MAIPSQQVALLRGNNHIISPHYNVWTPSIVATARVNQSGFGYPVGELTVDETSADWLTAVKVGMRYEVLDTDGVTPVTTGVVRKPVTANTLFIDGKSLGDPGYTALIATGFRINQYIRIYDDYPLWSLLSRIVNRVFYKQFDIPYSGQGSNPAPVVNLGAWRQAFVDPNTNFSSFSFQANPILWYDKTAISYAWELPSEAVITSGGLTSSAVTFTLPPGFYTVACTVTDSGGVSRRAVRPIWVNTRTGDNAPTSRQWISQYGADRQGLTGRTRELSIVGQSDIVESTFPRGAYFHFIEEAWCDGVAPDQGILVDDYVGFAAGETRQGDLNKTQVTFELRSPYEVLDTLAMVSQAIIETASPSRWTEVAQGLATPNFLLYYIIEHHAPNLHTLFDWHYLPETPPRKRSYALNGGTVQQQLQEVVGLIKGNAGAASSGAMYTYRNPMIETQGFRNALDERYEITDRDIVGDVIYPAQYRPNVGQVYLYGFALVNNEPVPLASVAPGRAQSQGIGRSQSEAMLVGSQNELNQKAGHLYAYENSPTPEIQLRLRMNLDIFDPARHFNTWWRVNISADRNPRGTDLNFRALVTGVDRVWSETVGGAPIKEITVTLRPETFGQAGETMPVNRGGGEDALWEPEYKDPEEYAAATRSFAFAWDDLGAVGRTYTFKGQPKWENIKGDIRGIVVDIQADPFSPLVESGFAEGALGAYAVVMFGEFCQLWYTDDLLGAPVVWEKLSEQTMNDTTSTTAAALVVSDIYEGLVVFGWRDRVGTWVVATEDGGATFQAAIKVDSAAVGDINNDNAPFGLALDGDAIISTGRTNATDYVLRWANGAGASFQTVTNSEVANAPLCPIRLDDDGTLYVGRQAFTAFSGSSYSVTVDAPPSVGWVVLDWEGSPRERIKSFIYSDGSSGTLSYSGYVSRLEGDADGDYVVRVTATMQFNRVVDVDSMTWEAGFNYITFVGVNEIMTTEVVFYDISGNEIVRYSANTLAVTGATVNIPALPGTVANVHSVTIEVRMNYQVTSQLTRCEVYLDNIAFTTIAERDYADKLYAVTGYSGSSTWDDITPALAEPFIPRRPYGFTTDPIQPGLFTLIGYNFPEIAAFFFESDDYGVTWTEEGIATDYYGIKRVGDIILWWGESIYLRTGGIDSLPVDKSGDWNVVFLDTGEFLGVLALL